MELLYQKLEVMFQSGLWFVAVDVAVGLERSSMNTQSQKVPLPCSVSNAGYQVGVVANNDCER